VCDQETSCDEETITSAGLQSQREMMMIMIMMMMMIIIIIIIITYVECKN
jgi:hypothetical protein